jgi:hypothetical protein
MQLKKKELMEIIDSNGDLIGKNDMPTVDANADTQANNTTDYNAKIGTQPFRYDMLGRFGFTLMPFMEGKDDDSHKELMNDLADLMHDKFVEVLEYYFRNPNKIKSDFRKAKEEEHSEECKKADAEWADKAAEIIRKHLKNAFKEPIEEAINEAKVAEDKVIDKKSEDEMSNKSEDKEVRDKKIEKIAGLINKLEKKDKEKIKNLLERK